MESDHWGRVMESELLLELENPLRLLLHDLGLLVVLLLHLLELSLEFEVRKLIHGG